MIWAALIFLGVPIWLCAVAVGSLVLRNRSLRRRFGDIPVRLRPAAGGRWRRGHAVWIHDVLAFRASPAAWQEELLWVDGVEVRPATDQDRVRHLGDEPMIARLSVHGATPFDLALAAQHAAALTPR